MAASVFPSPEALRASSEALRRARVVAAARLWLGTPYRHQGVLRGVGCDCLGLLRGIMLDLGLEGLPDPPPYRADWAESGGDDSLLRAAERHLVPAAEGPIRPGEVLLFRWRAHLPAKHCALATGPDAMIHAHDGACVCEVALGPWWTRHLAGRFDLPGKG